MRRWWGIVVVGLAFACKGNAPADPGPAPEPAPVVEPAPEPAPVEPPAEPVPVAIPAPDGTPTSGDAPKPDGPPPEVQDAMEAYLLCRDRVEEPEAAGECKTSADCGSGGCSGEMCVARSHGTITSTCEVRACFAMLDSCGCVEGKCQWSLKAAPPRRTMPPLE